MLKSIPLFFIIQKCVLSTRQQLPYSDSIDHISSLNLSAAMASSQDLLFHSRLEPMQAPCLLHS